MRPLDRAATLAVSFNGKMELAFLYPKIVYDGFWFDKLFPRALELTNMRKVKGYLHRLFNGALGASPPKPRYFTQQNVILVEPELVFLDYKTRTPAKEYAFSISHGIHGAQLGIDTSYLAHDIVNGFRRAWTRRRKQLHLQKKQERDLSQGGARGRAGSRDESKSREGNPAGKSREASSELGGPSCLFIAQMPIYGNNH